MPSETASKNAYELLGVRRNAGVAAIRRAWGKMVLRYHPDAVPSEEKTGANERCALINQAYALLCDSEKRRKYNALLDRGIIPDLAQEVGEVPLPALADIIGEIQALDLKVDQERLLAGMDKELREELLLPVLMSTGEIKETVVDVVRCDDVPVSVGYNRPPGEVREALLVVTELRLIILMRFVHRYGVGSTEYTQTYYRSYYFWYPAMTNMLVHEFGQTWPFYFLELEDDKETRFVLELSSPRLPRLFLVANTYHLPLKIRTSAKIGDELRAALGLILALPLLWCIPFAVRLIAGRYWDIVFGAKDASPDLPDLSGQFASIYDVLTTYGLTTLVVYLTPPLLIYLMVRFAVAWRAGSARDVIGTLKTDYADDEPILDDEEVGAPPEPSPVATPAATPSPLSSVTPPSDGPVVVDVPEAVRDVLGNVGAPVPESPDRPPPADAGRADPPEGRQPRA
jgi:hypothetical protein